MLYPVSYSNGLNNYSVFKEAGIGNPRQLTLQMAPSTKNLMQSIACQLWPIHQVHAAWLLVGMCTFSLLLPTHAHTELLSHTHTHSFVHTFMRRHMHMYTHIHMHILTYTHTVPHNTHSHRHTHTHKHTHTHAHTWTHMLPCSIFRENLCCRASIRVTGLS
jgi:hypothetical protein